MMAKIKSMWEEASSKLEIMKSVFMEFIMIMKIIIKEITH
jgi:hypothetical protein